MAQFLFYLIIGLLISFINSSCAKRANYGNSQSDQQVVQSVASVEDSELIFIAERPIRENFDIDCESDDLIADNIQKISMTCEFGVIGSMRTPLDSDLKLDVELHQHLTSEAEQRIFFPKNPRQKWKFGVELEISEGNLKEDLATATLQVALSSVSHGRVFIYPLSALLK